LLNLARNAIEALQDCEGQDRTLAIGTTVSADGTVEVAVSDTGKGLPKDGADHVFETFYTTKPDGMGVGLSISRSILEAHGGRLWATPNPAGGTVFHFTLNAGERAA
jgi:two-component system sensor kinase FixL